MSQLMPNRRSANDDDSRSARSSPVVEGAYQGPMVRLDCGVAGPLARSDERLAAGLVEYWLPAVEPRLRAALRQDRLARPADFGCSAGFGGGVDSHLRQGTEGVAGESPHATRAEAGISCA